MPAVIDPSACNRNFDQCFPAKICPESAITQAGEAVVIDSDLCGVCPGPCVNFCDGYAIRFDPDPDSFEITKKRVLNEMSADEEVEARKQLELERQQASKATVSVIDLSVDNFEATIRDSETPVVVDFWASWCGPCKQFAPVFEKLSAEYEGRVTFAKLNVDEEPQIAGIFGITSIPTLLVFNNGEAVDGAVGAIGEAQLRTMLDKFAKDSPPEDPANTIEVTTTE